MTKQCNRCKRSIDNSFFKSVFDNKTICYDCQQSEIDHLKYEEAVNAVIDSISKGDYEFEGIGCPDNLKKDY